MGMLEGHAAGGLTDRSMISLTEEWRQGVSVCLRPALGLGGALGEGEEQGGGWETEGGALGEGEEQGGGWDLGG